MKKSSTTQRKPTPFFIAFLVIALVFLAFGLGTLGSFGSTGEDFELRAPIRNAEGIQQESEVVFELNSSISESYVDEDGKEQTRSISLLLDDIYFYVNAIYSEAGTPAGITALRSSSSTQYFGGQVSASLENLFTEETEEETQSNTPLQKDALYRWVHPFTMTSHPSVSTYRYWKIAATGSNIRLGEVLFIGRPTDSTTESNQSRYIIPASVRSATPNAGEKAEEAVVKAGSLLDGDLNKQVRAYIDSLAEEETRGTVAYPAEDMIPADPSTSYDTFTKEEIYSLLTITEMRVGNVFTTNDSGVDTNIYHIDGVYNTLGMCVVALGTEMFGVNPFGLRFMPMMFSFGILVLGYFFVQRLFKSDRAGFIFAVLYALCDLSFSLGHVGTPLTAGLFFVLLAAYCVDSFYRRGMKRVGFMGLAPLLFGGLSAAAAICVNGAMLIPVLGVCGLYVAGMIRQQKANKVYLDNAIENCEAAEKDGVKDTTEVARVISENRYKNLAAGFIFPISLILGAFLFSLLFILPVYSPLVKFYDDPASPAMNVFSLGWKAFVGGFAGSNVVGNMPSAWNFIYRIFLGTGENRALTAAIMNPVAALVGLFGIGYAIYKIVKIAKNFEEEGKELRRILPLLAGVVISLVTAAFGGGALGFIFLAYIFSFMLAAYAAEDCMNLEGTAGKAAKGVTIAALVLLIVCFALLAIFTFSVPVPSGFMVSFFQG